MCMFSACVQLDASRRDASSKMHLHRRVSFDSAMIYMDDLRYHLIEIISISPSLRSSFGCFHGHVLAIRSRPAGYNQSQSRPASCGPAYSRPAGRNCRGCDFRCRYVKSDLRLNVTYTAVLTKNTKQKTKIPKIHDVSFFISDLSASHGGSIGSVLVFNNLKFQYFFGKIP